MSTTTSSSSSASQARADRTALDDRPKKRARKKRVVKKGERVYVMLYSGGRLRMSQAQLQQKKQVRRRKYFATLGARVDTRYFIVLHSTKTPVLYRTNTHMDKSIMGDSGPLAAQKSFSE